MLRRIEVKPREGVAAVEFAVVLPLLMITVLGSASAMNNIRLKHNAELIAHSAASSVSKVENRFSTTEARFESFASATGLKRTNVEITRSSIDTETVTATVTIPMRENSPLIFGNQNLNITAEAFIYRTSDTVD